MQPEINIINVLKYKECFTAPFTTSAIDMSTKNATIHFILYRLPLSQKYSQTDEIK
jgi:hypothetical protein